MFLLTVSEKILSFVCGVGILQGVLLAILIFFHRKSDKSVNVFLALYILATSATMSIPLVMRLVGWQNSFFIQPVPLLSGPLLYLYLRSFKERITLQKALPHFIIFFLYFFITYWNLSVEGDKYPGAKEVPTEAFQRPITLIIIYTKAAQQIVYYLLSRKTLLSYQRSIGHLFSETSRIDLHWTRFLVNYYLVLVSVFLVLFPLMIRYTEHFTLLLLINMTIATPYIYLATYKGIIQPTIWQVQPGMNKKEVVEEMQFAEEIETAARDTESPRTTKTGLSPEKVQEIAKRITGLMEQEQLYQETELTLQQLAEKLELPTYQVSQVLNDGMKKKFYDLVNGYRVEEAKRLLLDTDNRNYTILSVGFEAGFNSKTTFNTVFKKFTGLTPTEFRDKQPQLAEV